MPLTGKRNQYFGVNAHANGWLQTTHKWRSFDSNHITDMTRALNDVLKPGYIAVSEESLQIERDSPQGEGNPESSFPRPDVSIFDQAVKGGLKPGEEMNAGGIVTPTIEMMNTQLTALNAIVIYRTAEDNELGRPVARIELLSPTNKPPYSGARDYELGTVLRKIDGELGHELRLKKKRTCAAS